MSKVMQQTPEGFTMSVEVEDKINAELLFESMVMHKKLISIQRIFRP
jgi:hypothetical protein